MKYEIKTIDGEIDLIEADNYIVSNDDGILKFINFVPEPPRSKIVIVYFKRNIIKMKQLDDD